MEARPLVRVAVLAVLAGACAPRPPDPATPPAGSVPAVPDWLMPPSDLHAHINSVAFSPDGKTLAVGLFNEAVLWDLATGAPRHTLGKRIDQHCGAYEVAFTPDGAQVAGWLGPPWPFGPVNFWNAATGDAVRTVPVQEGKEGPVFALGADGTTLAMGSDASHMGSCAATVILWDSVAGKKLRSLTAEGDDPVASLALSPDGRTAAAGTMNGAAILWDATTGARRLTLAVPGKEIRCQAFTPDDATLATGQEDGTIILWDAATGAQRRTLNGHLGEVRRLAFAPDGTTLASCAADAAVILWDPATGTARRTLSGHRGPVAGVAFSRDGRRLASASDDGAVILWDATTGEPHGAIYPSSRDFWLVMTPAGDFACSDSTMQELARLAESRRLPADAASTERRKQQVNLVR